MERGECLLKCLEKGAQILARSDRLALSLNSLSDRQLQAPFLNLYYFSKTFCHVRQLLVPPIHEGCDVIHASRFLLPHSERPATQRARASNSTLTQGEWR